MVGLLFVILLLYLFSQQGQFPISPCPVLLLCSIRYVRLGYNHSVLLLLLCMISRYIGCPCQGWTHGVVGCHTPLRLFLATTFPLFQGLLNLGSKDPSLRLAAYNLLCALTATFSLHIEERLLEAKGIFIVHIAKLKSGYGRRPPSYLTDIYMCLPRPNQKYYRIRDQ